MSIDLHEMANLKGFGEAGKKLDALGHKRERNSSGQKVFTVEVEYSIGYTDTVEVEAETEEEAKKQARKEVSEMPNEECPECVEIYSERIV